MTHPRSLAASLLAVTVLAAAPPGEVTLDLDISTFEVRGEASAPVLIVEFSDFKCHACEKFNLTIMPNLEKEFIKPGKVKVIFVDFPLIDEDHYTTVAESVHCAGKQGKYWEMHDRLWERIGALGDHHLIQYATELGLDAAAFKRCLDVDEFRPRILQDLKTTYGLELSARPTFFIGRRVASKGRAVYRGRYVVGAQNYVLYRSLITKLLAEAAGP